MAAHSPLRSGWSRWPVPRSPSVSSWPVQAGWWRSSCVSAGAPSRPMRRAARCSSGRWGWSWPVARGGLGLWAAHRPGAIWGLGGACVVVLIPPFGLAKDAICARARLNRPVAPPANRQTDRTWYAGADREAEPWRFRSALPVSLRVPPAGPSRDDRGLWGLLCSPVMRPGAGSAGPPLSPGHRTGVPPGPRPDPGHTVGLPTTQQAQGRHAGKERTRTTHRHKEGRAPWLLPWSCT